MICFSRAPRLCMLINMICMNTNNWWLLCCSEVFHPMQLFFQNSAPAHPNGSYTFLHTKNFSLQQVFSSVSLDHLFLRNLLLPFSQPLYFFLLFTHPFYISSLYVSSRFLNRTEWATASMRQNKGRIGWLSQTGERQNGKWKKTVYVGDC